MQPARVLIVDDEPIFRGMVSGLLTQIGFTCTEAPDGRAATSLLNSESFDLGIFDIVMPGMSGWELASIARAVAPEMCLVAVTAYDTSVDLAAFGFDAALQKPFRLEQLACICQEWRDGIAETGVSPQLN